jgi:hypothetical protein
MRILIQIDAPHTLGLNGFIAVEGAELQLFSSDASNCLPMVKFLIIETQERFRPGSELAVGRAAAGLLEELPSVGENLFFRRK